MPNEVTAFAIALAIAIPLMLGTSYALRRMQAGLPLRVALGVVCLVSGVLIGGPLVFGEQHPLEAPLLFGLAAGLAGLGINQIGSPLRVAAGRSA